MPTLTTPTTYPIALVTRAHRRCTELATEHPTWPQARVRKTVAGELGVKTWVVRYLLGRG